MRRLALFAGGFSLGIFLAQFLLAGVHSLWAALAALLGAFASLALPWSWRRRAIVVLAAVSLGLGWNWLYTRQIQRPAEVLAETEEIRTAAICGYAVPSGFGARVTVRLEGVPGKAVLYGGEDLLEREPGQRVSGILRLRSAARIRDEDITAFTSKGVFLLAYAKSPLTVESGNPDSPRWYPLRAARAMRQRIAALFPEESAGFLTAILTGERGELSETSSAALAEAGLSHLVAVSGMHCAFLMALAGFLLPSRRFQAFCGIPLLAFYAALTGGSPSVLRACVMLSLPLLAVPLRRENDGPTSLLAALFLLLLVNPFAAASVSLQLSFAAMAGLLWLAPRLYGWLKHGKKRSRLFLAAAASVAASLGAQVFTAPLAGYYFGTLVLITPLSSLLCLWAASGVFLLGMAAVWISFVFPALGNLLAIPANLLTQFILRTAGLLAKIPGHAVYFANPYLKYWLAYVYLLFAAAYILRDKRRRKYLLASVLAALSLAATLELGQRLYQNDLDVLVLDVGQGQSIILSSGGRRALVDCGSANRWKDSGAAAAQQLLSMGCRRLDWLILTHYDSDHVSGITALLDRLPADVLLAPRQAEDPALQRQVLAAAKEHETAVCFVDEALRLDFGLGTLEVIPSPGQGGDNEEGLVILAAAENHRFLITGDMSAASERALLEAYPLPEADALAAGHHGSKYSTSQELLDALQPEAVCISAGSNAYGHPAQETLDRLARQGCAVYRTDLLGTIHLCWNGED